MTGELQPGARLSIRELARQIDVSAIPVREAVTQLVSEGLLEHKPGVGIFVVELSPQELAELSDLREALECHAIRRVAPQADASLLDQLRRSKKAMEGVIDQMRRGGKENWNTPQMDAWTLADAQFHMAILKAAGNRRTLKILSDLRVLTYSLGHRDRNRTVDRLERADAEHARILDAIIAHDGLAAEQTLANHLAQGARASMEALHRQRMEADTGIADTLLPEALQNRLHELERSASEDQP
jgi:DNA-binding GntR family transcriptional regulator